MTIATSQQFATEAATSPWNGFRTGLRQKEINVRDFIQQNYEPHEGDQSFQATATERTTRIWDRLGELFLEERKKGVSTSLRFPVRSRRMVPGTSIKRMERRPSDGSDRPQGLWVRA